MTGYGRDLDGCFASAVIDNAHPIFIRNQIIENWFGSVERFTWELCRHGAHTVLELDHGVTVVFGLERKEEDE